MPNDALQPYPPDRIAECQRVFSKRCGREITAAEAIEIMRTVRGLVKILKPLAITRIAERKQVQNSKPISGAKTENGIPDGKRG